jgi:hypothetical protein
MKSIRRTIAEIKSKGLGGELAGKGSEVVARLDGQPIGAKAGRLILKLNQVKCEKANKDHDRD